MAAARLRCEMGWERRGWWGDGELVGELDVGVIVCA